MMKKTIVASTLMVLMATGVVAQEAAPSSEVASTDAVAENLDPSSDVSDPPPTVSDILQQEYDAWLEEAREKTIASCKKLGRDLSSTVCNIDEMIIVGEDVVSVSKSHPRWIEARQLAYTNAMNKAYSIYAQQMNATNQVKVLSTMLVDDGRLEAPSKAVQTTDFERAKPGKLSLLFDKVYALGDGFLDKKLKEFNVDPAKYERQPIEVKKKLFENQINLVAEFSSYAQTSGMVPIQTFFGEDSDGKYGVKVVFTTAPNRIRLIRELLKLGADVQAEPQYASTQTIAERFKLKGKEMFDFLGTRLVYDEKGYPVLLSFGQASVSVPRNPPTFAQRQQVARSAANSSAMNTLTLLLSSQTNVKRKDSQNAGVQTNQSMLVDAQDNAQFSEMTEELATRYFDETISTSGRISNFQGAKTIHTWTYYDQDSKKYVVGSVLMWSPETAMQTREQKQALTAPVRAQNATNATNNTSSKQEAKSKRAKDTDNYVF